MSGGEEEEFKPSALGTKEHWDAAYERELHNFKESGDTGDIWFGEESMTRIIRWLEKQKIPLDSSVLDIGTGNGILLVELGKSGYTNLTGVDYSPSAVQLSKNIMEKEGLPYIKLLVPRHVHQGVNYKSLQQGTLVYTQNAIRSVIKSKKDIQVEDILKPSDELPTFQICIDKGTFDAISLNSDGAAEKRKQYVKSLQRVLRSNGFFLITSCNWTKEELCKQFEEGFLLLEELPTPTFCFGGRTGNSVTALVLQKT